MGLYLISDTHFGHERVIEFCDRPFDSVREMNGLLFNNWNENVSYGDTVLFGGDLVMGDSGVTISDVATELNGQFVFLEGNHDDIDSSSVEFPVFRSYYFSYEYAGREWEFYYTHWPVDDRLEHSSERDAPKWSSPPDWFDGWYIHGHIHNNDIENYPFVNPDKKFVNVGAEVIGYTPIEIETLIEILMLDEWFETIDDVPSDVVL